MSSIAMPATRSSHELLHALTTRERLYHAMHRAIERQRSYEEKRDKLRAAAMRGASEQERAKYLRAASIMHRMSLFHMTRANHLCNCHDAFAIYGGLGGLAILGGRTTALDTHR